MKHCFLSYSGFISTHKIPALSAVMLLADNILFVQDFTKPILAVAPQPAVVSPPGQVPEVTAVRKEMTLTSADTLALQQQDRKIYRRSSF